MYTVTTVHTLNIHKKYLFGKIIIGFNFFVKYRLHGKWTFQCNATLAVVFQTKYNPKMIHQVFLFPVHVVPVTEYRRVQKWLIIGYFQPNVRLYCQFDFPFK